MDYNKSDLEWAIYRAVDIARFAPSSHNCQPWQLKLLSSNEKNASLELQFDPERMLDSLPSLTREMYLGCGIFLAYLLQALKCLGVKSKVKWLDDYPRLVSIDVSLNSVANNEMLESLANQIVSRRTIRARYYSPLLPERLIDIVRLENRMFPGDFTVHCGPKKIRHIKSLIKHYASLDFSNKKAWAETFRYIHFDETKQPEDGFYFSNLFGKKSNLFRWAFRLGMHPLNHFLYSFLNIPKLMAHSFAKLLDEQDYILALTVADEQPETIFNAGQALGRLSLELQNMNWVSHPLSVLVQHDNVRAKVMHALEITQPLVYIARLGQSGKIPRMAPRRTVESILVS